MSSLISRKRDPLLKDGSQFLTEPMKSEYLVYYTGGQFPEIVADALHDFEEAQLFAEYLSVNSRLPLSNFRVVVKRAEQPIYAAAGASFVRDRVK